MTPIIHTIKSGTITGIGRVSFCQILEALWLVAKSDVPSKHSGFGRGNTTYCFYSYIGFLP
jgi:hypothetical protein